MKGFTLDGMVKNADGTYSKAKTVPQPRDVAKKEITVKDNKFRKLTLTLFGEPMPKQSVRASNGHFWQPHKTVDRKNDYIRQIKEQLPEGFIPFETEVHLRKFHCVFAPLKAFHKIKGRMDAIRNGEIFYKNTKPDVDNLLKLPLDSITKSGVWLDDSLIVSFDGFKKTFGTGGMIIIEIQGY